MACKKYGRKKKGKYRIQRKCTAQQRDRRDKRSSERSDKRAGRKDQRRKPRVSIASFPTAPRMESIPDLHREKI